MKKYFGSINLSYKKIIIFAVLVAVYVGLINSITLLRNTSFQDIAINLEWWILFAVFIISNSKNVKEAVIKCFLFFLISQPLIYLIEVPFSNEGFNIFRHYFYWFKITLLTIPGTYIAYQIKRDDWLSVIVITIANSYLIYQAHLYLQSLISFFPNHLLSFIFCIFLSLFLIFVFISDKIKRIVSISFLVVLFIFICILRPLRFKPETEIVKLPKGNWTVVEIDEGLMATLNNNELVLNCKNEGDYIIVLKNEEEKQLTYWVTIYNNEIYVDELD